MRPAALCARSNGKHPAEAVPSRCSCPDANPRVAVKQFSIRWGRFRGLNSACPSIGRATRGCCLALLLNAVCGSGCAHFPVNAPLAANASRGYYFHQATSPSNSQETLLLLAFSGGGMRASAVEYGVLEEMNRTEVGTPGKRHPLTDEVDGISCVSGGIFPAACFVDWERERFFTEFEPRFLKRKIESRLVLRSLTPRNRFRLISPTFNMSDLAAEYYDRLLFHGATYADLAARPERPFLLINATDSSLGERFRFTQDEFDLIGSDLSQLPLCRAVAAGAAFPGLLTPIVLKNYSATNGCLEPDWIGSVLSGPDVCGEQKGRAMAARSYHSGDAARQFIHLVDGGIADDQGLRSLAEVALGWGRGGMDAPAGRNIRRIAIINVDAEIGPEISSDGRERPPPAFSLVTRVVLTMLRRYSSETTDHFRRCLSELRGAKMGQGGGTEEARGLDIYMVELHFGKLADRAERQFFNSVPTRFQLSSKSVERLIAIARSELRRNEEFLRLVRDLGDEPVQAALCPDRHVEPQSERSSGCRNLEKGMANENPASKAIPFSSPLCETE